MEEHGMNGGMVSVDRAPPVAKAKDVNVNVNIAHRRR